MAEKEKKPSRLVNWLAEHPMRACVIVLSVIAMAAGLLLGGINELTYQSPEEKLAKNLIKPTQPRVPGKTCRLKELR